MTTPLTVPEVLRRAEQIIGERGHYKGANEDGHGRVCAYGAILIALSGEADPTSQAILDVALDAAVVVEADLDPAQWGSITLWNDAPERTETEVRAALLAAAAKAETS